MRRLDRLMVVTIPAHFERTVDRLIAAGALLGGVTVEEATGCYQARSGKMIAEAVARVSMWYNEAGSGEMKKALRNTCVDLFSLGEEAVMIEVTEGCATRAELLFPEDMQFLA